MGHSAITSPEGSELPMNSTTSKTIAIITVLAIALAIVGCFLRDEQVTFDPPPPPQVVQPSHPVENPLEPRETDEQAPPGAEQAAPAKGTIVEVDQGDFEQEVIQADMPVVVDFWAEWCRPCHMIKPTLEQLAEEFAGKVKFVSVNDDANPKLTKQFSIRYLPTIVIIDNGEEIDRAIGVMPPKQLRDKIAKVLSSER